MYWHFAFLQMSTLCIFVSLLEHYQCFPREDVCLIFVLEILSQYTPKGAGSVLDNIISEDHVIQYHPCCHWISSKKNIPTVWWILTMSKSILQCIAMIGEWPIFYKSAHGCMSKTWFSLIPDTRNTRWFWKLIGYGLGIEKYFGFGSGIGWQHHWSM